MDVTNAGPQRPELKEKIRLFYTQVLEFRKNESYCPVQDVMAASTDKWSLFIIYNIAFNDVMRFSELKKRIPGISSRMLSVNLSKLSDAGLVRKKIYAEVPPRTEYRLTEFGFAFAGKLVEINSWLLDYHLEAKH